MYRKYLSTAFIYAVIAMVWGVFYREFTKFAGFSGKTALSVIHVHYFALGMIFFLLLALLAKHFAFSAGKGVRPGLVGLLSQRTCPSKRNGPVQRHGRRHFGDFRAWPHLPCSRDAPAFVEGAVRRAEKLKGGGSTAFSGGNQMLENKMRAIILSAQ